MIGRFSAYGFLKNQRYFEPFLVLLFLERGLTFFEIGLLVAIRELTINLTEIISGAVADVYGRRASMVASMFAYIASFLLFGFSTSFVMLAAAMVLFGCGDAFRTGTHKAMIFTWLRLEDRLEERTEVYGYTRSWSKLGSALSVVIGTALVLALDSYTPVFFVAIVPYVLNIANLATYPARLDAKSTEPASVGAVFRRLRDALRDGWRDRSLRRLILESMGFEGTFSVAKEYLQPVLKTMVLGAGAIALLPAMGESQRVAVAVGPVYFVLFLLSAWASRRAASLQDRAGGEDRAATVLWIVFAVAFAAMLGGALAGWESVVVLVFVVLYVLQNVWRPILIARIDTHAEDSRQATVLSVESQAKSLAAMITAPLVGLAVDATGSFWPVAVLGLVAALVVFAVRR